MASLKLLLGLIPATAKLEQAEKALISEFEKLNKFAASDTLKEYNELSALVTSSDFQHKKKEIESLSYKGSDEYAREKEFISLEKAKDIVMYFRTVGGQTLKKFKELDGSDKIKSFEALQKEVTSLEFRQKSKSKDFRGTDDAKKLDEYNRLNGSTEIKEYFTFLKSKEYANFKNIDGSSRLARYNELKEYTATDDFKQKKNYLLDKKRFEKTEMFKQHEQYDKLKKSEDIIWYFKVKDSNKFEHLKHRELLFSEEFESDKLDTQKWLTNYYWGEKLLKDRYSVEGDLQVFTEKENFEFRNSCLKINTKSQKINGKVWSALNGFTTKEFGYSSGLVNTGIGFRQKYGVFSAKIKLGDPNAKAAFWLVGEKSTPHIDICRTGKGKVWVDLFTSKGVAAKSSLGSKYANDFFIYTLEWSADKLVWKINDTEIATQTSDVPQEPMYISLSGGLDKPISSLTTMEIDWVRVYMPK
jgi:beta-glucanase (GH16 family)